MTTTATAPTYVIRRTREFYGPSIKRDLVNSDGRGANCFNSPAEARAFIAALDQEVYHTSQNESGRPEYKVLRSDTLPQYLADLL